MRRDSKGSVDDGGVLLMENTVNRHDKNLRIFAQSCTQKKIISKREESSQIDGAFSS